MPRTHWDEVSAALGRVERAIGLIEIGLVGDEQIALLRVVAEVLYETPQAAEVARRDLVAAIRALCEWGERQIDDDAADPQRRQSEISMVRGTSA